MLNNHQNVKTHLHVNLAFRLMVSVVSDSPLERSFDEMNLAAPSRYTIVLHLFSSWNIDTWAGVKCMASQTLTTKVTSGGCVGYVWSKWKRSLNFSPCVTRGAYKRIFNGEVLQLRALVGIARYPLCSQSPHRRILLRPQSWRTTQRCCRWQAQLRRCWYPASNQWFAMSLHHVLRMCVWLRVNTCKLACTCMLVFVERQCVRHETIVIGNCITAPITTRFCFIQRWAEYSHCFQRCCGPSIMNPGVSAC